MSSRTWFDRQVDRLLPRLMPTFSVVLWWLPELIAVFVFGAMAVVTGLFVLTVPVVIVVSLVARRVVAVRRENNLIRSHEPPGVSAQADASEDTDASEVAP